jgi:Fe-S cluster assembly protein SufD
LSKGFPTKKDEEYKYTNLKEIVEKDYNFSLQSIILSKKQLDELHLGEEHFDFIVFVNGKLHKELSNISVENAEFLTLILHFLTNLIQKLLKIISIQLPINLAFCNLNEALHENGFFLHVPKNVVIEKPIHVFIFLKIRKKTLSITPEIYW